MTAITGTPTNINLNGTTPPPPPGAVNIGFQAGEPYEDPNDPSKLVRDTSAYYFPSQVGGAVVLTDNYQLGSVDSGNTFIANSPTPITLTMPPVPPSLDGKGIWSVRIVNIGIGAVTINLNGTNLDGGTTNPVLQQFQGQDITTDGIGYYSGLKASGFLGGVVPFTGTAVTLDNSVRQKLATISNAAAVAVALNSTVGAAFTCWVKNLGAGTATFTPTSGTINGVASITLATGQGAGLFFDGTNWQAVTSSGTTVNTFAVVSALEGQPAASELVMVYTAFSAQTFPANFGTPNSYGSVGTNPTATATYTVKKNGATVGTVAISTGGVFTFATSGGSSFSLAAGDRLTIVAPSSVDATLSDVAITLVGTR